MYESCDAQDPALGSPSKMITLGHLDVNRVGTVYIHNEQ